MKGGALGEILADLHDEERRRGWSQGAGRSSFHEILELARNRRVQ